MKYKLNHFLIKLFLRIMFAASALLLVSGCTKEQFWGVDQIRRPESSAGSEEARAAGGNEEITTEQARKYLESGIAKVLDSSSYNIETKGKIEWKEPDQTVKVLEYENKIILDRNAKCFRQDWLVKDTAVRDKPVKGSAAGIKGKLYFVNGSGQWEQGNSQLFSIVFSNTDSVIKHLNSIQLYGSKRAQEIAGVAVDSFFRLDKAYYEKSLLVIEASLGMDAESAAASRGLFSAADVELSTVKVDSFNGNIKIYIRTKDSLIVREEISGSYVIGGEKCTVSIKVEIDKINETIDLKLPANMLDTQKQS